MIARRGGYNHGDLLKTPCVHAGALASAVFGATISNRGDEMASIRLLEHGIDRSVVLLRQLEREHPAVVAAVLRHAEARPCGARQPSAMAWGTREEQGSGVPMITAPTHG